MTWSDLARLLAARGAPFLALGPGGEPAFGYVAILGYTDDDRALRTIGPGASL